MDACYPRSRFLEEPSPAWFHCSLADLLRSPGSSGAIPRNRGLKTKLLASLKQSKAKILRNRGLTQRLLASPKQNQTKENTPKQSNVRCEGPKDLETQKIWRAYSKAKQSQATRSKAKQRKAKQRTENTQQTIAMLNKAKQSKAN